MPSPELERLADSGLLHREPPIREELQGLVGEATAFLRDAKHEALALESRFSLAYGAVYALALAALRANGYRPRNRQVVFQALAHTLGTPAPVWRMLATAHARRNAMEYEGSVEVDDRLVQDLIQAGERMLPEVVRRSRA